MNSSIVLRLGCLLFATALPICGADKTSASRPAANRLDPNAGRTERAIVDYVLQPQDTIRVYVFQEEDINKQGEVGISSEHTITLPLIGTVNLRGKSVRQAEDMIRALYDKDYLVNPTVSVSVLKYSDRSVNVTGAVNEAKRIQFPPEQGLTIVDAIAMAGGYSRLADLKRVKLTRRNAEGEPETKEINVEAIMKGNGRDIRLETGDSIQVPERII